MGFVPPNHAFWWALALLFAALGGAAPAKAQDAPTAEATAVPAVPSEPETIPTADIGRRIEETFHELQDVTPRLRRERSVRSLRDRLPDFVERVEQMREVPALAHLDALAPRRLMDLEQEWARIAARVDGWQTLVETRLSELSEARLQMRDAEDTWEWTRDTERDEPLPASLRARIDTLVQRIVRVIGRLDRRLSEVLEVSGELSDEGLRVASMQARIASARQRAREERQQADHHPLWTGGDALPEARPEPDPAALVHEHRRSLEVFASREALTLGLHLAAFLLLAGGLLLARRRYGPAVPRRHAAPLRALRARPIASAGVLCLVLAPFLYPYLPSVARAILLFLGVPLLFRLAPFSLGVPRRRILELVGLAGLSLPMALGYAPAPVRRIGLLVVTLVGLAAVGRLVRELRAAYEAGRPLHRLHWALPLAALPLLAAAWANISGSVEAAAASVDGTFVLIELVSLIFVAVGLISALIAITARHPYARFLRIFAQRRRVATETLRAAVRTIAAIAVVYAALVAFDVLDPISASLRVTMRETHEFGSIELSGGDILSFVSVIAGTFVVVRLVHFVLGHEILPRLELGPGTEAAISLTVSYLLVALGVILAFGLAGVDPEQLALLGGALGVGIGFGLQNVVGNFVSGLILVAERPIKVGDVIEVGNLVGQVQRIGIRSSTVRALTGAEVIVPNSELISGQLVNWTLSDARRRVDLAVGTGYQHDPEEVRRILEGVLAAQPGIPTDPPSEVLCTGFGDSSIDFILRFWTTDYIEAVRIKSLLAERVYRALAAHDIEIPFPQRDLHVRSMPPTPDAPSEAGNSAEAET